MGPILGPTKAHMGPHVPILAPGLESPDPFTSLPALLGPDKNLEAHKNYGWFSDLISVLLHYLCDPYPHLSRQTSWLSKWAVLRRGLKRFIKRHTFAIDMTTSN